MLSKHKGSLAPGLIPRHVPGEITVSYAARLEARLGMASGYLWSMARARERRMATGDVTLESIQVRLSAICERMTGLSTRMLVPYASQEIAWHACEECTGGVRVQLGSGDGHLVCQEHKRWIGPRIVNKSTPPGRPAAPDGYHSRRVSDEALRADARIDDLVRSSRAPNASPTKCGRELPRRSGVVTGECRHLPTSRRPQLC